MNAQGPKWGLQGPPEEPKVSEIVPKHLMCPKKFHNFKTLSLAQMAYRSVLLRRMFLGIVDIELYTYAHTCL